MSKATIKPVSDLRDYNKVLKNCRKGEPVILTKNGRGVFVVMSIDEYDEIMELCARTKRSVFTLQKSERAIAVYGCCAPVFFGLLRLWKLLRTALLETKLHLKLVKLIAQKR